MKYLLFATLLMFSSELFAEQIQARTIAIKPYGFKQGEQLHGVYFELLKQVLITQQTAVNHGVYPYARIAHGLKMGSVDITIMFQYAHLVPYVTYIAPLPELQNVVLSKKENKISSIIELEDRSLAYLRGATFSEAIDSNAKITKVVVTDFAQGMRMLKAGRVDAIIGPFMPLLMIADDVGIARARLSSPLVVSTRTPWLQVSNKSLAKFDLQRLKSSFEQILHSDEFKHIQEKYHYHTLQSALPSNNN